MREGSDPRASPVPSLASLAAAGALRGLRGAGATARLPGGYLAAVLLMAAIAPVTAGGAGLLGWLGARDNAAATRRLADRIALAERAERVAAAHDRVAAAVSRVTVTDLVARMARALPPGARLQRLAVDGAGAVDAAIDCPDPDALRAALAGDPLLATLRPLSQSASPDAGVRVTLASRAARAWGAR